MLGTKIKQHENNLYHLNSEKSKLDDSILHLQGTFVVPFKDFLSVWQVEKKILIMKIFMILFCKVYLLNQCCKLLYCCMQSQSRYSDDNKVKCQFSNIVSGHQRILKGGALVLSVYLSIMILVIRLMENCWYYSYYITAYYMYRLKIEVHMSNVAICNLGCNKLSIFYLLNVVSLLCK